MSDRPLRNESTSKGKETWEAVDRAADRAPEWVKRRVQSMELNQPSGSSEEGSDED